MVFVHGDLIVRIISAVNLPTGETYNLGILGKKLAALSGDHNDPYVNVKIGGALAWIF